MTDTPVKGNTDNSSGGHEPITGVRVITHDSTLHVGTGLDYQARADEMYLEHLTLFSFPTL